MYVGIDIGCIFLKSAGFDEITHIQRKWKKSTQAHKESDKLHDIFFEEYMGDSLVKVDVNIPNSVSYEGNIVSKEAELPCSFYFINAKRKINKDLHVRIQGILDARCILDILGEEISVCTLQECQRFTEYDLNTEKLLAGKPQNNANPFCTIVYALAGLL